VSACVICREREAVGLQCEPCRSAAAAPAASDARAEKPTPAATLPPQSEDEIRRGVREWYRLQGAKVWDTEQGYRPSACRHCGQDTGQGGSRVDKGMPDLVVLTPRGLRFVELKSAKGRQTPEQREFQAACERAGTPYLLARSVDEVIAWESAHAG
jgi:hypothetical protein